MLSEYMCGEQLISTHVNALHHTRRHCMHGSSLVQFLQNSCIYGTSPAARICRCCSPHLCRFPFVPVSSCEGSCNDMICQCNPCVGPSQRRCLTDAGQMHPPRLGEVVVPARAPRTRAAPSAASAVPTSGEHATLPRYTCWLGRSRLGQVPLRASPR